MPASSGSQYVSSFCLCSCIGRRNDEEPRGGFSSAEGCGCVRVCTPVLPFYYWLDKMGKGMDSTSSLRLLFLIMKTPPLYLKLRRK